PDPVAEATEQLAGRHRELVGQQESDRLAARPERESLPSLLPRWIRRYRIPGTGLARRGYQTVVRSNVRCTGASRDRRSRAGIRRSSRQPIAGVAESA